MVSSQKLDGTMPYRSNASMTFPRRTGASRPAREAPVATSEKENEMSKFRSAFIAAVLLGTCGAVAHAEPRNTIMGVFEGTCTAKLGGKDRQPDINDLFLEVDTVRILKGAKQQAVGGGGCRRRRVDRIYWGRRHRQREGTRRNFNGLRRCGTFFANWPSAA